MKSFVDIIVICFLLNTYFVSCQSCFKEDELILLLGKNYKDFIPESFCLIAYKDTQHTEKRSLIVDNTKNYDFEVVDKSYMIDFSIKKDDIMLLQHIDDLYIEDLHMELESYYLIDNQFTDYSLSKVNYNSNKILLTSILKDSIKSYNQEVIC